MDESKKSENRTISKIHFSKLHERVQNKYAQMQMRLQKSRSMESVSFLNEEFAAEKWSLSSKNDTIVNKMPEKVRKESTHNNIMHSAILENVSKQDAVEDIINTMLYEAEIYEENQVEEDDMFIEHGISLENIHEESNNQLVIQEDILPSSPSKRISVGERIKAAIERRRELKNREKRKKSESTGIDSPDKIILSNKPVDASKRKNKVASVAVALVEVSGPENEPAAEEKARQLYCRIRLGQEKHKSKIAQMHDNLASWQELCNFNLYEDNFLEITLWEKEKDMFVGRVIVDLSQLKYDKTHKMKLRLEEDESVELLILVTMSAAVQECMDIDHFGDEIKHNEIMEMQKHFVIQRNIMAESRPINLQTSDNLLGYIDFFDDEDRSELINRILAFLSRLLLNDDFHHVGMLHITVYEAAGLAASDCFAVFMVGNDRCQTHTEHRTHSPEWMRIFTFEIKDATSILYVIIYDEKKSDIVGRLAIPLLKIHNGAQKWYALKDAFYTQRAKGQNPRILLEMTFYFNFVRQSIRLINPKERVYLEVEPEFSRQRLARNIKRIRVVINWITAATKITKTLFEWESKKQNTAALAGWLIFWYNYEAWMLPLLLLIPFYWYRPAAYHFSNWQPEIISSSNYGLKRSESITSITSNTSVATLTPEKGAKTKTSFKQKLQSVADMITTTQNGIGKAASIGESIKNLFNFTVPFISCFSIFGILGASVILYYTQVQYILMVWGVHKYLRKILRPNRIPNNEIMDLLSRVPDDEILFECKEIPVLTEREITPISIIRR